MDVMVVGEGWGRKRSRPHLGLADTCLGTEEDEQNVLYMMYEWKTGVILKIYILRICLVGCVL